VSCWISNFSFSSQETRVSIYYGFRTLRMEAEGTKRKLEDISKEVVVSEYDTCVHCKCRIDINSDWAAPCNYHIGEHYIISL
jgi:hypothetical protein